MLTSAKHVTIVLMTWMRSAKSVDLIGHIKFLLWGQLSSATRPFLFLRRVWLARLAILHDVPTLYSWDPVKYHNVYMFACIFTLIHIHVHAHCTYNYAYTIWYEKLKSASPSISTKKVFRLSTYNRALPLVARMAYVYINFRFLVCFQLATSKPMLSCSRITTSNRKGHVCWLQLCPSKPQPRVSLFSHNPVQGRGVDGDVQEGEPGQFEWYPGEVIMQCEG